MSALTHEQFADFFLAVHKHVPFDWQRRLAREVLSEDGWHDLIRVPTACGKTSVLDLAVYELALQADLEPNQRTAARRICFVVDRRLVVDEVTDHAREIRVALEDAARGKRQEPVLREVSQRLAQLAADSKKPLRLVRLRGAVYRDDGWAADPLTPTILVSTVDQIGSRLLFRGYGVSSASRPVHAGLLAFDTCLILDEAHLSTVFAATLNRIRQYQQWANDSPLPDQRRVSVVRMSATADKGGRVFELKDKEPKDRRLKSRIDAHKLAELMEVKVQAIPKKMKTDQPGKAREREQKNRMDLIVSLVEKAKQLAKPTDDESGHPHPVVGVVVNRVATARQVCERLREKQCESTRDVILLTGRIRAYDRDRLLQTWLPRIKAWREVEPERPLFVVATQTVEVGANIDFDVLVSEAAPLDALRQRFGRVDRIGRRSERGVASPAAIIIRSDHKTSYSDPIYGSAIGATWKWLEGIRDKQKRVDLGVNCLDSKLKKVNAENLRAMLAPQPEDPLLFPAHLDAWVQTDPEPEPDPDVAPFLHGRTDSAADVQIVWRADLEETNQSSWRDIVALMPPRTREALPIPVYEVKRWLSGKAAGEVADVEGPAIDIERTQEHEIRRALRWRGAGDALTRVIGPQDIRPGDTIVVPSPYGGADEFGWKPGSVEPVRDVADACLAQLVASYPDEAFRRPKLRLRLHSALFTDCDEPTQTKLRKILSIAISAAETEGQDPWPVVQRLLAASKQRVLDDACAAAVDTLLHVSREVRILLYPGDDGMVLVAPIPLSLPESQGAPAEEAESDELEDDAASLAARGPVTLSKHTQRVADMVGEFGTQCGLDRLLQVLRAAAHWHDQGKRDSRFQGWLHGSEIKALVALAADRPLAKSGRDPMRWGRSDAFGYPRGSRHEFVSVRLFEEARRFSMVDDGGDTDLTKFLIGTHHGHGRAFVPVVKDRRPVSVTMTDGTQQVAVCSDHGLYRLDAGWTDLFWLMVRRYGWWGLAYLEAILVTADHVVSARERQLGDQVEVGTA